MGGDSHKGGVKFVDVLCCPVASSDQIWKFQFRPLRQHEAIVLFFLDRISSIVRTGGEGVGGSYAKQQLGREADMLVGQPSQRMLYGGVEPA